MDPSQSAVVNSCVEDNDGVAYALRVSEYVPHYYLSHRVYTSSSLVVFRAQPLCPKVQALILKFNTLWHRHPRRERSSTAGIQNLLRCLTDKIRWSASMGSAREGDAPRTIPESEDTDRDRSLVVLI